MRILRVDHFNPAPILRLMLMQHGGLPGEWHPPVRLHGLGPGQSGAAALTRAPFLRVFPDFDGWHTSFRTDSTPRAPHTKHRNSVLMQPPQSTGSSNSANDPQCVWYEHVRI